VSGAAATGIWSGQARRGSPPRPWRRSSPGSSHLTCLVVRPAGDRSPQCRRSPAVELATPDGGPHPWPAQRHSHGVGPSAAAPPRSRELAVGRCSSGGSTPREAQPPAMRCRRAPVEAGMDLGGEDRRKRKRKGRETCASGMGGSGSHTCGGDGSTAGT
jgi:hypothetical protein